MKPTTFPSFVSTGTPVPSLCAMVGDSAQDLPPSLPSPHELASGFSRVIREWFTPDELAECVRRNASEEDPGICHSHDFYDANMAMAEAWELLTSLPCYGEGSPDGANALWDAAWNLAKASNFTL